MLTAFSTALSALNASELAVDVVGNNLANLNSTGFKASTASFGDMMSQELGADGSQVGMGTTRARTFRQFTQGAIQASGGALDAAIQGGGYFVVRGSNDQLAFTRDGTFHLDASGTLLTASGQPLQGWVAVNGTLDTSGATGKIVIPGQTLTKPVATTKASLVLNLDAATAANKIFSTPIQVVDSLGSTHVLTLTFTKGATANSWDYSVTIPGEDVTAGKAGTPTKLSATGNLTFDSSGNLTSPAAAAGVIPIKVPGLADGAADMSIDWSLYGTDGTSRVTQFAAPSSASAPEQDGVASGQLTGVTMTDGGKLLAKYSNGDSVVVAQLALASIRNPESLVSVGDNLLELGPDSAEPAIGVADSGGRGKIVGGALESSTVDIAREFTNLIVYQRSYQASARVITTADQISQEVINLKR